MSDWEKIKGDQVMKQTERDLAFLEMAHKMAKGMGMSDEDIIRIAKTNGGIDPEAMEQYLAQYPEVSDE